MPDTSNNRAIKLQTIIALITIASAIISTMVWVVGYVATKKEVRTAECRLSIIAERNRQQIVQIVNREEHLQLEGDAQRLVERERAGTISTAEMGRLQELRLKASDLRDEYRAASDRVRALEGALRTGEIWSGERCISV